VNRAPSLPSDVEADWLPLDGAEVDDRRHGTLASPLPEAPASQDEDTPDFLDLAFKRWPVLYRRSFPTDESWLVLKLAWQEMLDDHEWLTEALFLQTEKNLRYRKRDPRQSGLLWDLDVFLEEARRLWRAQTQRAHDEAVLVEARRKLASRLPSPTGIRPNG
jgi:hypothetical protein